ncbi:ribonuclease H-like domain-containing protein [Tanacetum coccineum]|uniref:Ribonuclease H-like domain-containing protein n=1 Tax=Tanacetum coccineum TaxID=301880 RepID=A0ABQ4WT32_9ASTR
MITWTKLKRHLTNKYCPRTEVKKMEDEFYNLVVKEDDLKTYIRRFQELAVLCPNMVPNFEKHMEAFIEGLPQSIKGNVTASKPQTLEEAVNIAQRLMDHILKHNYKCKKMKLSQDMQLIQKLRDDQKRMKKVFEVIPVVKPTTIRTVLSLALSRHWSVHQLDVKNAFFHEILIWPQAIPSGLVQRFAAYVAWVGFHHIRCDSSLFIYRQRTDTAYLLLYVDDIVLIASSQVFLQRVIASLLAKFSMTDLGPLNYVLGISMTGTSSGMFLSQKKLAADGDPVSDPTLCRSLAGPHLVIMYLWATIFSSGLLSVNSRSSAEAEYRGVANAVAETYWLRNLLHELHTSLFSATIFYRDNVSVVYRSSNPVQH